MRHLERHTIDKMGWLRAAVLGANDGIVSTASLIIGIASADASHATILTTATAGLVAGAMSMAAGEYVSVSSQADGEAADLRKEQQELIDMPEHELNELTAIYMGRGLDKELARQVAIQLTERDALGAHARDELGITQHSTARPIQAALTSAAAFAIGAALPVGVVLLTNGQNTTPAVGAASLLFLALLGAIGAQIGGAKVMTAVLRVVFWGTLAMAITAGVGLIFGATV